MSCAPFGRTARACSLVRTGRHVVFRACLIFAFVIGWNMKIQARESNYGTRVDYILVFFVILLCLLRLRLELCGVTFVISLWLTLFTSNNRVCFGFLTVTIGSNCYWWRCTSELLGPKRQPGAIDARLFLFLFPIGYLEPYILLVVFLQSRFHYGGRHQRPASFGRSCVHRRHVDCIICHRCDGPASRSDEGR